MMPVAGSSQATLPVNPMVPPHQLMAIPSQGSTNLSQVVAAQPSQLVSQPMMTFPAQSQVAPSQSPMAVPFKSQIPNTSLTQLPTSSLIPVQHQPPVSQLTAPRLPMMRPMLAPQQLASGSVQSTQQMAFTPQQRPMGQSAMRAPGAPMRMMTPLQQNQIPGPRIPLNPPLQGSLSKDQSQLMTMPLQQPQFPMVPPGAMLLPGGTTPVPAPIPMSVGAGPVPPADASLPGSAMMVPVSVPEPDEKVLTP